MVTLIGFTSCHVHINSFGFIVSNFDLNYSLITLEIKIPIYTRFENLRFN